MLLENMNWKMVEKYLKKDDRIVMILGSIEEHGLNSMATDTLCAFEIAKVACENMNIMLGPAMPFGPSAFSLAYPGTISISVKTYMSIIEEIIESLVRSGFKRILFFSGHGGNSPAKNVITEYVLDRSDLTIRFREWYEMDKTLAFINGEGGSVYDHASWLESFPWINQVEPIQAGQKPQTHIIDDYALSAQELRAVWGDGMPSGDYVKSEDVMRKYFDIAVKDLEDFLQNGWDKNIRIPNP